MRFLYSPISSRHDVDTSDTEDLPSYSVEQKLRPSKRASWKTIFTIVLVVTGILDLLANVAVLVFAGSSVGIWNISRVASCSRRDIVSATKDNPKEQNGTHYGINLHLQSISHDYDYLWDRELAGNNGIISLPDLGPHEEGAISMFHQLHCLSSLRKALQHAAHGEDIGTDYHDNAHWPHCFDYLRSTLMCNADSTIEMPISQDGKKIEAISGAWDARKCGNAPRLYELRSQLGKMENPPLYEEVNVVPSKL